MKPLNPTSRRLFLRQAGALSALGMAGAPLALNLAAMGSAAAQTATDYKALVCIFLYGGNDGFSTVLPTDAASFANYTAVRNQMPDPIALLGPGVPANLSAALGTPERLGGVLPINPLNTQGRSFALHPTMASLRNMFNNDKRLAVVANVGALVQPTSKTQYSQASHPKPPSLFSHNDQQNIWQTFNPEGATVGWGGRLADLMASQNSRAIFTSISAAGNAAWLSGETVQQYQIGANGAVRLATDANGQIYGSTVLAEAMARIVTGTRGGHVMEADLAAVSKRAIDAEVSLRNALKAPDHAYFGTPAATGSYDPNTDPKLLYDNPGNGTKSFNNLARQLQIVARMIDASDGAEIGAKRQVFFVGIGGFDTHDRQNRNHADLLARLAHAMRYFDNSLGAMGARNKVTAFTASDFGRTFTSNGDGTDHGWGSHHFVMGGAVKGGDIYGDFPVLGAKNAGNNNFDSSPNQISNGSLIPEVSVDQMGATLARWFGLTDTQLLDVFPHLVNFDASKRNLGFMN